VSIIRYVFLGLASFPVALILTIILLPFWRWLEAATEIEAVGHSGPATWCYLAIYAILILCVIVFYRPRNR